MSHEIGNVRGQSRASGRRERRAAGLELRQRALRSRVGPGSSWHRPAAAPLAAAGRGERGASRSCGRSRAVLPGTGRQVRAGREENLGAAVGSLSPGTQTLSRQGAISERGDPKLPILRQNTGRGLSVACPEGPCPTAAPARPGSSVLISAGGSTALAPTPQCDSVWAEGNPKRSAFGALPKAADKHFSPFPSSFLKYPSNNSSLVCFFLFPLLLSKSRKPLARLIHVHPG